MRFSQLTAVFCLGFGGALVACSSSTRVIPFVSEDGGTSPTPSDTVPTEPPPSGGGTACERICEKAASANCSGKATCVADCEADQKALPAACKAEADAVQDCALSRATGFKCSSKGKVKIAGGCDAEGDALGQCVLGGSGSGSSSSSGGSGGAKCGGLTSGDALCDSCLTGWCCPQATNCGNDADCLSLLACFQSCNDDACYAQCENAHPKGKLLEQSLTNCVSTRCSTTCP